MIAPPPGCTTPVSNTGLIPQYSFKSSVDTLTLVLRKVSNGAAAMDIKSLLERELSESIDFDTCRPTFMMRHWDGSSRKSVYGVQLHWKAPSDEGMGQLRIHIPGRAIAASTQESFRDCVQVLSALYGGDCTRIDVAVDDEGRLTPLSELRDAQDSRNYTGVRSHRRITSGGLDQDDGMTFYFGSKASDSQLRVYDKKVESKGKVDCIRWELQLRRDKAAKMCSLWLGAEASKKGQVGAVISGAVAGAVDFIDRSRNQKDLSRCDRLTWWEQVRAHLSKAYRLQIPPKPRNIEKKIGWLCHAVMPSMALIKRYLGDRSFWQFVEEEIGEKEPLLSPGDLRLIDVAKAADKERLKLCEEARKIREYFEPAQLKLTTGMMTLD